MQTSQFIFKAIGAIHGLAGVVLLVAALDKNFQKFCFYKGKDPFVGDLHKSLALFGGSLLIACGAFAFFKPDFAVGAAWLSFLIYLLPSLADLLAGRPLGKFCKECAVSFSIRALAVVGLTTAMPNGWHGQ